MTKPPVLTVACPTCGLGVAMPARLLLTYFDEPDGKEENLAPAQILVSLDAVREHSKLCDNGGRVAQAAVESLGVPW